MSTDPALAALARVRAAAKGRRQQRQVKPPTLSSAGPDDRDPQLLGGMLTRWVRGNGYSQELAVAGVAERWPDIVGPQIAQHAQVTGYEASDGGGELVVQADSQEWALQLRYLTSQLQQRIDDQIGAGVVTRITVKGPNRTTPGGWRVRTGRRSPRQPAPQPAAPPAGTDAPPTLDL